MPQVLLLLFIVTLIVFYKLFQSRIKGVIGEKKIAVVLRTLDQSKFKVINNVVLQSGEKTSQIDHIVISDFGVFVIETKNYKGWILGNEHSEYWTQVIYKRKEKLYNPIRQNLGHIRTLKKCLTEFPYLEFKSIIVFSSRAELKVNTLTKVVYTSELKKTIKQYSESKLTEKEKENIFKKIHSLNKVSTFDQRQHIQSIQQRIKKRKNTISQNKCPQCGGALVVKKGKFGKFIGCSNFPKCRNTINL